MNSRANLSRGILNGRICYQQSVQRHKRVTYLTSTRIALHLRLASALPNNHNMHSLPQFVSYSWQWDLLAQDAMRSILNDAHDCGEAGRSHMIKCKLHPCNWESKCSVCPLTSFSLALITWTLGVLVKWFELYTFCSITRNACYCITSLDHTA